MSAMKRAGQIGRGSGKSIQCAPLNKWARGQRLSFARSPVLPTTSTSLITTSPLTAAAQADARARQRFLMSFAALGLVPELSRAVAENGYSAPTPIQSQAIPAILDGRDVLAGAQTGTGKTAAFVLPILQRLGAPAGRTPRALVLTPTRELAAQVAESARKYGSHTSLRTQVVFGGVGINPQIDALRGGCDLLVATPGRLLDLAQQRELDLRQVSCLVLDEADRM